MPPDDLNELVPFTIRLPKLYERRLRLWAFLKGTNRANQAQSTIQARIEANLDAINADLKEIAQLEGLTLEQLTDRVLSRE